MNVGENWEYASCIKEENCKFILPIAIYANFVPVNSKKWRIILYEGRLNIDWAPFDIQDRQLSLMTAVTFQRNPQIVWHTSIS
jgi:hypothetical protein